MNRKSPTSTRELSLQIGIILLLHERWFICIIYVGFSYINYRHLPKSFFGNSLSSNSFLVEKEGVLFHFYCLFGRLHKRLVNFYSYLFIGYCQDWKFCQVLFKTTYIAFIFQFVMHQTRHCGSDSNLRDNYLRNMYNIGLDKHKRDKSVNKKTLMAA